MSIKTYVTGIANALSGKPAMLSKADLGWVNVAMGNTYGEFKSNDYENAYPSITKITNKFMKIKPYAVDGNGDEAKGQHAVINALYHPNKLNSSVEFREALALMYLVHPKTHILVWRKEGSKIVPGGKITPQNIAGFTFMEGVTTINVGGKTTYTVTTDNGSAQYTDDEVITLRGLDPYHINSGGFSATQAASKWMTLDDLIAQYQKGHFQNGAVPSGELIITASTTIEFNDIVDKLQEKHRGAGKNNNIVYTHRPIDKSTGKPANAQIEWVPYANSNKELSLKDLFEQANMKIDSNYGVPASIRGVGENNNYATARTDQQNFMENIVDPIALKIWTGITHELNRITGGLGIALAYDIVIPALADEEKVKEEREKIRDERVQAWLEKGYSLSSIKAFLESGDILDLEVEEVEEEETDDPDVDEGNEVKRSADPQNTKPDNKNPQPKNESVDPSVDAELVTYEMDIENALKNQIDKQATRAITEVSDAGEPSEEEDENLTDEILAILLLLLLMRGSKSYNDGITLALAAGVDISNTSKYLTSIDDIDRVYLKDAVKSFNLDTTKEINAIISQAKVNGATKDEIKKELAGLKNNQTYRTNRFAANEAWRISEIAGVKAMVQLNLELNTTKVKGTDSLQRVGTYKVWNTQPSACSVCMDYSGQTIKLSEQFFGDLDSPPAHVTCRCKLSYTIVKEEDQATSSMELHCNACDRFLGVTDKAEFTDKLKCSNSSCKVLDIPKLTEMNNGK